MTQFDSFLNDPSNAIRAAFLGEVERSFQPVVLDARRPPPALDFKLRPYQRHMLESMKGVTPLFAVIDEPAYTREMRAEMAEQVRRDICAGFEWWKRQTETSLYPPARPMPTYEEMTAALHRAANPTPADRAATILSGRKAMLSGKSSFYFDSPMTWPGTPEWLEVQRAIKRVQRTAPRYAPFSAPPRGVLDLARLRDYGYQFVSADSEGFTLRSPDTIRAFWTTVTVPA
jgi:hypothetical protein